MEQNGFTVSHHLNLTLYLMRFCGSDLNLVMKSMCHQSKNDFISHIHPFMIKCRKCANVQQFGIIEFCTIILKENVSQK